MNERLQQEIYNKIEEIDSKHNGTSWDEEDLILFAQALYKLALEDIRKICAKYIESTRACKNDYNREYIDGRIDATENIIFFIKQLIEQSK